MTDTSDATAEAATNQVDELYAEFLARGAAQDALDEIVYETANRTAAQQYNDGDRLDLDDDDAYETLHDTADSIASGINNGGPHAQLTWLLGQWGPEGVRSLVAGLPAAS